MRTTNDLASKQAERKLKIASAANQQRTLKVNLAQTEAEKTDYAVTKRKPKPDSDQSVSEKLLAKIQEIKMDINHLKDQVREKQQADRYRRPPRVSGQGVGLKPHVDANNAKARKIRIADTVLNVACTVMFGRFAGKRTNQKTGTGYLSGARGNQR